MDIYSPKFQKPYNFNKNTIKEKVNIHKKSNSTNIGTTIIFEFEEKKSPKDTKNEKKNFIMEKIDFLKSKFYERMKMFFDYEEKSKENVSVRQNW